MCDRSSRIAREAERGGHHLTTLALVALAIQSPSLSRDSQESTLAHIGFTAPNDRYPATSHALPSERPYSVRSL